jgi:hypothetical protein
LIFAVENMLSRNLLLQASGLPFFTLHYSIALST